MNEPIENNRDISSDPRLVRLKKFLISKVSADMQDHTEQERSDRAIVRGWLADALRGTPAAELSPGIQEQVLNAALADLIGYGPLELLLSDPDISEIIVNGVDKVFIERAGELHETGLKFDNEDHVMRIIGRIVNPLGRRVDSDSPTADARLPDGSRVNVVIPPVAVDGPHLTIRKFLQTKMTMDDLLDLQALTPYMAKFIEACVVARLNILVTGNTSSGKTTILNVLSSFIPENERIITIEDAVELKLKQRHVVRLETKLPGVEIGRAHV